MIYLVTKNFGSNVGSASVAIDILESLVTGGRDVQPICLVGSKQLKRPASSSFPDILQMPKAPKWKNYSKLKFGSFKYLIRTLQCFANTQMLKQQSKVKPDDVMVFNNYDISSRNIFNVFKNCCRTIQIVHVSPAFVETFEDSISVDELLGLYEKSDEIVFVSEKGRNKWLSYGRFNKNKTHYIPNCANEEKAAMCLAASKESIREKLGLKKEKFYLVSVASISRRKGQDLLINAAPFLKEVAPNIEILIIGDGQGPYRNSLTEKLAHKKIDYVSFLGGRENAMEYIYSSDMFVLMSRSEALPLVILESMLLKTPVIASNVDGVPEMIEDGLSGLLFESNSVEEIVRAFTEMYNNPEARERYSEKASDIYWTRFSKRHFARRYGKLLD